MYKLNVFVSGAAIAQNSALVQNFHSAQRKKMHTMSMCKQTNDNNKKDQS